MSTKSRAEYFRKPCESIGQLNVAVPKEKLKALEKKLQGKDKSKTQWVNKKIDEELGKGAGRPDHKGNGGQRTGSGIQSAKGG